MHDMNKVNMANAHIPHIFNTRMGVECHEVRQPSLVDEFYVIESDSPRDSTGRSIGIVNPLHMLLNQKRLDRLGPNAVQAWLQSMKDTGNNNVKSILSRVSDDELLAMVKSRHIQAPCELDAYLQALNSRMDLFNSEVAKIVAQQKAEQDAMVDDKAESKVQSQIK